MAERALAADDGDGAFLRLLADERWSQDGQSGLVAAEVEDPGPEAAAIAFDPLGEAAAAEVSRVVTTIRHSGQQLLGLVPRSYSATPLLN